MKCPNCGVDNGDEARFCKSCATPLQAAPATAPAAPSAPLPPPPMPAMPRRRRQPYEELVGLLGLAFFLVAVSVAFAQNPNLTEDLRVWTQIVSNNHTIFVRPPDAVIVSAAWFFGAIGLLELVAAGMRWVLRWMPLRAAGRVLSGVGDLMFAALLTLYAARSISGTFLLTVLVGVMAILLMIYITLGIYWSAARPRPPEFVQPRIEP